MILYEREACLREKSSYFIDRKTMIIPGMGSDFNSKISISEIGLLIFRKESRSEKMPIGHNDHPSGVEEIGGFF